MNRVFVDMDGVIVDFDAYKIAKGMTGDEVKKLPGAYLEMPPIPGAIDAVRSIIGMGFEVWIATKPPTGVPYAYSDKAAWVFTHLPELKRRIIITHDKGLLGGAGDFLCDDRPHKANCQNFAGTLPAFGPTWFPIGASFVLLVSGAGLVFASLSMIPEYQADEFCASLLGRHAVADGIHWMAQRSGRGMNCDRVKRLKRLGFPPAQ